MSDPRPRSTARGDRPDLKAGSGFWPSPWSWVRPALLLVALYIGLGLAPADGSKAFYEASVQVIPVIALTLAIEARAFEWSLQWAGWRERWNRGLDGDLIVASSAVAVLFLLVIAEIISLAKLASHSFREPRPVFVFAAMVVGLAAVVLVAVPSKRSAERRAPH